MPLADLVIIRVVCGGNLDRTSTERHVDDDGVCDDGYTSRGDEGMLSKFAVQVLFATRSLVGYTRGDGRHTVYRVSSG